MVFFTNPVLTMSTDPLAQYQWNFVRTRKFFNFYVELYENKFKNLIRTSKLKIFISRTANQNIFCKDIFQCFFKNNFEMSQVPFSWPNLHMCNLFCIYVNLHTGANSSMWTHLLTYLYSICKFTLGRDQVQINFYTHANVFGRVFL